MVNKRLSIVVYVLLLAKWTRASIDEERLSSSTTEWLTMSMPNAQPRSQDTYLCTSIKVPWESTRFVVGFEPNATASVAHHMLLFGCEEPGSEAAIFNCGTMTNKQPELPSWSEACKKDSAVIYAWAQNAPKLELPEGVAFRIGKGSYRHLVLQVHYATVNNVPDTGDTTGVRLKVTRVPQPRAAGVLVTASGGRIPAWSTTHMETACALEEPKVIHPFAFRVHTHALGTVVSGFKVVNGNQWSLLGKANPQLPQMFYPIHTKRTMTGGDVLAVRCTMVNRKGHAVWIGSRREDEMCNFYLMYYVESEKALRQKRCYSPGRPIYSWDGWFFGGGLSNIPNEEASTLSNGYYQS